MSDSYTAFISYSHREDSYVARSIQKGLHRFAKPWQRLRALSVFLDESDLAASPSLWSKIENALKHSEFFILLASPASAASPWVHKEVDYWVVNKSIERVFIVLLEGNLTWDSEVADFRWDQTTPLPENMRGKFKEEPRYVDLRWAKSSSRLSIRQPAFRQCILDLAAPLHGRNKSELEGEDVRQLRRLKSITAARRAKELEAESNSRSIISQQLATNSAVSLRDYPQKALLLAVEAVRVRIEAGEDPPPAAEQALLSAIDCFGGHPLKGKIADFSPLAVSRDGKWVAAVDPNNDVFLWHAENFEATPTALRGYNQLIQALAFSPNNQWLVCAGNNETAWLWSTNNLLSPPVVLSGHEDMILSIAISPDSTRLATGSYDGTVRVWNLSRPKSKPLVLLHPDPDALPRHPTLAKIDTVIITEDGRRLIAVGAYSIWIRDLSDPEKTPNILRQHGLERVFVARDGSQIACADTFGNVKIWRLDDLKLQPIELDGEDVEIFAFTGDSSLKRLATGGKDDNIRFWDLDARDELSRGAQWREFLSSRAEWSSRAVRKPFKLTVLNDHRGAIKALEFSSDGQFFVSGSADKTGIVWGIPSLGFLRGYEYSVRGRMILRGHEDSVDKVAVSSDNRTLVTLSSDSTVRVWDLNDPWISPRMLHGHTDTITCVAVARDNSLYVTGSSDGDVRVSSLDDTATPPVVISTGDAIRAVAISPDCQRILTCSSRAGVCLWDLKSPIKPRVIHPGNGYTTVGVSSELTWLAMDGERGDIRLLGTEEQTLEKLLRLPWDIGENTAPPRLKALAFSRNGEKLATVSEFTWTALVWNLKKPTESPIFLKRDSELTAVAISPNGQLVAVGGKNGTVALFNTRNPQNPTILRGLREAVACVAISSDVRLLVASGGNESLIWKLSDLSSSPINLPYRLALVTFSAANNRLIGTWGKAAYVWNLRNNEVIQMAGRFVGRNFSTAEWERYFPNQPYRKTFSNLPAAVRG